MRVSKEVMERLQNMAYDNVKKSLKQKVKLESGYSAYQYKQNKYKNKKVLYDGIKFDSIKEKNHYVALKMLEKAGIIKELELQKKFELQPSFVDNDGKKQRAITYIADFFYYDKKEKLYIAEDVKSVATRKDKTYNLKKKMFLYQYPNIIFKEIL